VDSLPENTALVYSFSLNDRRVIWGLQVAGLFLTLLFACFFLGGMVALRPNLELGDPYEVLNAIAYKYGPLRFLISALAGVAVSILLHELVHGAFFWFFTRHRPAFGLRIGYAFAGAPGWYLPRRQHLVVGLAPLVLLSLLGLLLLAALPAGLLAAVLFGGVANAAGAVGDLWVVFLELRERREILVEDLGDRINFYAPA
jgi:hypothetical protein